MELDGRRMHDPPLAGAVRLKQMQERWMLCSWRIPAGFEHNIFSHRLPALGCSLHFLFSRTRCVLACLIGLGVSTSASETIEPSNHPHPLTLSASPSPCTSTQPSSIQTATINSSPEQSPSHRHPHCHCVSTLTTLRPVRARKT